MTDASGGQGTGPRPWEYSAFAVTVAGTSWPSPHFRRITLAGPSLRNFAPWGLDQRIKLVLPRRDGSFADVGLRDEPTPHPRDWYARWKSLPESERNVLRTYTPSAVRPDIGEIDVDVFIHEPAGPASRWALDCAVGDEIIITGPDIRVGFTGYGIHFVPPTPPGWVVLVGDESALPAIVNVARAQRPATRIDVLLELADVEDVALADVALGDAALRTTVVPSEGEPGTALERLVRDWADAEANAFVETGDRAYLWIAGETGAVAAIRRYLTRDVNVPPTQISFLGYWKRGGPLVG